MNNSSTVNLFKEEENSIKIKNKQETENYIKNINDYLEVLSNGIERLKLKIEIMEKKERN